MQLVALLSSPRAHLKGGGTERGVCAFARERQRGGKKRGGGGGKTSRGPHTENSFRRPSRRYVFPLPPYGISLNKSLRGAQNFPQLTSETAFGGSQKMVSDGPSSRGFAFRYVLPPPPSSSAQICFAVHCLSVRSDRQPYLVEGRPNCARQSLASTVSAPRVAATLFCHPGRHANVVAPCLLTPGLNVPNHLAVLNPTPWKKKKGEFSFAHW